MPFLSTDAIKPSDHLTEQCYALGSGPWSPILIDAVTDGQQASIRTSSNTFGTFSFGGNLYKVVVGQQVKITLICKSVDSGATWTRLDAANSPLFSRGSAFFDGTSTVIFGYVNTNLLATLAPIRFRNFDLVTETWGPIYGSLGAPSGEFVKTVWKRPDGTLLALHSSRIGFNPGDPSGIAFSVYDPSLAAWIVSNQDVGQNITLLLGWDPVQTIVLTNFLTSYMDSLGNIGVFFNTGSFQLLPVIWGNRCFYQQILANNTLGSFFDFPGQVQPLTAGRQDLLAFSGSPLGIPSIVGNTIVLPVLETNRNAAFPREIACVYLGTPVANPVWSTDNSKSIDPEVFIDTFLYPQETPTSFFDGTTLFAVFVAQDADFTNRARLRYCQTANLLSPADGWSGQTAFDIEAAPPGFNFAGQALSSASLGAIPSSPPAVVQFFGIGGGGHIVGGLPYGAMIGGCRRRNDFDWCMFREKLRYEKIRFPRLCSIPKEYSNWLPWDEDFGANAIPPGAVPLNRTGGILTPFPGVGDQVVIETRVPFGYDGLLAGVFHFYTGKGFEQGSGDILWRVQVNQRYLENLGNIEFTLGSPQSPCPLTEGQILLSGQTLRYIVNVPNLSGLIQVGQSQIACGLVGFFWPR